MTRALSPATHIYRPFRLLAASVLGLVSLLAVTLLLSAGAAAGAQGYPAVRNLPPDVAAASSTLVADAASYSAAPAQNQAALPPPGGCLENCCGSAGCGAANLGQFPAVAARAVGSRGFSFISASAGTAPAQDRFRPPAA